MPLYFDHGCQCFRPGAQRSFTGFGDVPPPRSVLDALFASINPLITRYTEVAVAAQTAWAPDSAKSAWLGNLNQANRMLQNASIDGQLGQRFAMGDASVADWRAEVNGAADLIEYVSAEVTGSSYSIRRIWNEIVIPTAVEVGHTVVNYSQTVLDYGPYMALGLVGLFLLAKR